MAVPDDNGAQWFEIEHEELVSRLRRLDWPKASEQARQRCWEELSRHMAVLEQQRSVNGDGSADGARTGLRRSTGQRHEFTRPVTRPGLARRLSPAQSWSRFQGPRSQPSTI